jgi:sulfur-carrier protein
MSIRVLFFASLADVTGVREVEVDSGVHSDVGSIFSAFVAKFPQLEAHRRSLLYAVNSEFVPASSAVHDGDEVAFFPPVSGG